MAAAAAAAPAARRFALSPAVPSARRPALDCQLLRLLARRSGAVRAPEDRTATGRLSPGRAAKQVGGWAGTARTRSRGALGAHGVRGWGVLTPGRGLCIPSTNFPPAPWIPGAQPGSGLRKPSSVREEVSVDRMPGVRAGRGAPRRGLSLRSRDAAPAAGEDPSAAARRGCPGEGACPPLSLGTPTSERPLARRGPRAEPAGRGQIPRRG